MEFVVKVMEWKVKSLFKILLSLSSDIPIFLASHMRN